MMFFKDFLVHFLAIMSLPLIAAIASVLIRKDRDRWRENADPQLMTLPSIMAAGGVLTIAMFVAFDYLIAYYSARSMPWYWHLAFLSPGLIGVYMLVDFQNRRVRFSESGIDYRLPSGRTGSLGWSEITGIYYDYGFGETLRIEAIPNQVLKVHLMLVDVRGFAEAVLEHAPSRAISSNSRNVLGKIIAREE